MDVLLSRNRMEPGQQPAEGEVIKLRGWKAKDTPALEVVPDQSANYYTVVKGDTLWNIAQRYQATVEELKQWNNLPDNLIKLGMQLQVQWP